LAVDQWCAQVEKAAGQDVPVVVYRRSHQPWRVVLKLEDFIELIRDRT
jgi:hypothetical protein